MAAGLGSGLRRARRAGRLRSRPASSNGFMYTRLAPAHPAPTTASTKLAAGVRAARRHTRPSGVPHAGRRPPPRRWPHPAVARGRPSRWESEMQARSRGDSNQPLPGGGQPTQLDDADLARSRAPSCSSTAAIHAEMHFWLHGHDLGPIARYLYTCQRWGITAADALPALAGASPSTSEPLRQLVRLRALVDARPAPCRRPSTTSGRSRPKPRRSSTSTSPSAASCIVTRYDIDGAHPRRAARHRPAQRPRRDAGRGGRPRGGDRCALRAHVPDAERALFDEVLGDARAVMDMRDDNGPLTVEWPAGLLRRALLERRARGWRRPVGSPTPSTPWS